MESIIHKLTGGNNIDNRQQYIETSQCFRHIELCLEYTNNTQVKGNCIDIQPLAAEVKASYNSATLGYDPWPESSLSALIKQVSRTKNDLSENFNCD